MPSRDNLHFCSRNLICETTLRSEKLWHGRRWFEGEIGLIAHQNNYRYVRQWSTRFDLLQCRFYSEPLCAHNAPGIHSNLLQFLPVFMVVCLQPSHILG